MKTTNKNFDNVKYVRRFKKTCESSISTCRLKITGYDKRVSPLYREIFKHLKSLLKNPEIYENELIYITLNETEPYIEFIKEFRNTVKDLKSKSILQNSQEYYISKQLTLFKHLKEMDENPKQMPTFMVKNK